MPAASAYRLSKALNPALKHFAINLNPLTLPEFKDLGALRDAGCIKLIAKRYIAAPLGRPGDARRPFGP